MKRNERKDDFCQKNVSRPSNPPDELAQNVSKKNRFWTNYCSIFSSKVQNLTVFSIIYMIRIRFFGPRELVQKYFRAARYVACASSRFTGSGPIEWTLDGVQGFFVSNYDYVSPCVNWIASSSCWFPRAGTWKSCVKRLYSVVGLLCRVRSLLSAVLS